MHSLRGWNWLAVGVLVRSVRAVPAPIITPAPEPGVEAWMKRQVPDAASFAQVLLTAIPLSLRQIAATNAPAVSDILGEEFLDDNRPPWFSSLPWDIQSYLVKQFGPETATIPPPPQTTEAQATPTQSSWEWVQSTDISNPSQEKLSVSHSVPSSGVDSTAPLVSSTTTSSIGTFLTSPSSIASFSSRITTSTSFSAATSSGVYPASASTQSSHTPSTAAEPVSPSVSNEGLTKIQKIGLGVGVPFGILGAAAVLLGCCFCLRRRRNKHAKGSIPPSSPGFIPRFAFQDKLTEHVDHRAPLNPNSSDSSQYHEHMNWEDEGYDLYESTAYDPSSMAAANGLLRSPSTAAIPPMWRHNSQPVMVPALHHTHSSNRARGKRTSHSSLHSVAEITEPDENTESPMLGRQTTPLQRKRRPSMPMVLEIPTVPRAATIKRKPVSGSPKGMSPAAEAASQSLLRPTMRHLDHSGSSSSGFALSTNSLIEAGYEDDSSAPFFPIFQHAPVNPFKHDYAYIEYCGPEYQNGHIDHEDGLYGGNRSLDRYPDPSPPRRSPLKAAADWPLHNISLGHKRNRSPMWDRVYER
ncbi:hypothetical protein BDU57DRAFT_595373 [Ampelomyces quisqualis]|uniref:Mid2 domain-containing protein n=1 Tax=Ampelomyces quisqualis TaxID=50730 RepID=A0A6A5QLZ9_AMPQU|nr:hypothetical protein BDU57DRAFT_595373 [Ampelomyces quisqualis]